ncbi:MAG: MotA/TolQ/ExbB proton channel family protein [Candidatus Eisenbacteria bacterium]|nr:MotA/TolQ/ExbB proton channel family protein [Candidatus Eisenbacteria bacterium]MCC7141812.1 MotA/TolQ/ExbB proton channel family protein [Candidatus Eisenbacteria bacterium]
MLEWFAKGGVFMWPLLACSVIGLAFILERAAALHRADLEVRQFFDLIIAEVRTQGVEVAIESCKRRPGPIANIIEAGLQRFPLGAGAVEKAMETAGGIEASFLQRGLIWMATVANVAPLFGFLGTVSGMIGAFDAIAAADRVSAKIVASGISEALITTEAGLLIAIPVQTAHNYFAARIERLLVEVEESSLDLLAEAERRDAQRG